MQYSLGSEALAKYLSLKMSQVLFCELFLWHISIPAALLFTRRRSSFFRTQKLHDKADKVGKRKLAQWQARLAAPSPVAHEALPWVAHDAPAPSRAHAEHAPHRGRNQESYDGLIYALWMCLANDQRNGKTIVYVKNIHGICKCLTKNNPRNLRPRPTTNTHTFA